jgi:glycosyltransferase involved in cell wall biosynthesis
MFMATDKIWIIIPAYNEAAVIGNVVSSVKSLFPNVVVVDDCSTDYTAAAAADSGATLLRHVVNLGQGAALQTGIEYALRAGAEFVVTFDADGQHRPEDVFVLLDKHRATGADVVLGSRFLGSARDIPRSRVLLLKLAVIFTTIASGIRLTDAHNGLRLLTRKAAAILKIRQNRMAHASEITDQLTRADLSIVEAPVTVLYTEYSLGKGQRLANAINILVEIFVARLRK